MPPAPLEELVVRVVSGDKKAWGDLWARLEPRLQVMLSRPRFLGKLAVVDDERRNVAVEIMHRLHEDGFRRLASFVELRARDPSAAFIPWLSVVARRIAIDYIRAHDEYLDQRHHARTGDPGGAWIEAGTMPSDSRLAGQRHGITDATAARQMLSYAGHELPEEQRRAIELWITGAGFDQIAEGLGIADARDAERHLRAGLERLRRQFKAP